MNLDHRHAKLLGLMMDDCSPTAMTVRSQLALEKKRIKDISELLEIELEKIEHPNQFDTRSTTGSAMFYDPLPIDAWGHDTILELKSTSLTLWTAAQLGQNGLFMSGFKAKWLMVAYAMCSFGQVLFGYVDIDDHIIIYNFPKAVAQAAPGSMSNKYGKTDNGLYIPLEAGDIIR